MKYFAILISSNHFELLRVNNRLIHVIMTHIKYAAVHLRFEDVQCRRLCMR